MGSSHLGDGHPLPHRVVRQKDANLRRFRHCRESVAPCRRASGYGADAEIWDLHTSSGGWFHPLHIHLGDFQILSRNGRAPFAYERGPKDVAYIGPDELVRVIMKFERRGRYMVHCHNLPHEDHDMMGQFRVGLGPDDADPHDPIEAAEPYVDTYPPDPA